MLPSKDAGETINVTFDFGPTQKSLGVSDPTLTNPQFSSQVWQGTGGLTTVDQTTVGAKVTVQLSAGTRNSVYQLRCYATLANGERRLLEDFLPVK